MMTSDTAPSETTSLQEFQLNESAADDSKLRAIYDLDGAGPILCYQRSDSMTELSYLRVASDGSVAATGVVQIRQPVDQAEE